jgi:hypothetical protein
MERSQKWHTPGIAEIEEEIRWELQGVERGAQRVRETMQEQKVGDSEVGLKLMRKVAPKLVEAIKAAKKEAIKGIAAGGRGRPQAWWWVITLFKPEQLAVLLLKCIFSEKPREFTFNIPVVNVASKVSRYARVQLDFETWKKEEDDEFQEFLRSTKTIDERSFRKFSERIKRQRLEKWDPKVGIQFGTKLIELLTEAAPEWFRIETNRLKGGRLETQIVLTEGAKETLADLTERSELSRPMLLPMIIPPADWRLAA